MQWSKKELVVAANQKRIEVTVIPATLIKTIDLSGLNEEEKAKKVAETVVELQKEFIAQIHGLIGEVKPLKEEEPKPTEEVEEPEEPVEESPPEVPAVAPPTAPETPEAPTAEAAPKAIGPKPGGETP